MIFDQFQSFLSIGLLNINSTCVNMLYIYINCIELHQHVDQELIDIRQSTPTADFNFALFVLVQTSSQIARHR